MYNEQEARLQALKEEIFGITNEVKQRRELEAKMKADAVYNKAFWNHMYTGIPENALKAGSDGAGGYLVPDVYEEKLVEALKEHNILRAISTTLPTVYDLRIPTVAGEGTAQWVDESGCYQASDVSFDEILLKAYKVGMKTLVSDELLEDSGIDLEAFLIEEIGNKIGEAEEKAFLTGDGDGKPTGLITQASVGATTERSGIIMPDDIIELEHSVKKQYRRNPSSCFIMSNAAYQELKKVKTAHGRYIWNTHLREDGFDTLLDHRVYVSKYLDGDNPGIEAGSKPVLFGDFSYFWIGDRGKRIIRRLSERYADYGQVGYVASERVDAKLVLPEAIKVLKVKA